MVRLAGNIFLFCLVCCAIFHNANAQIEGIYCGKETCYSVLGVTRDDDKATIMRAYRKLARIHHPDRQKTVEGRKEAELKFKKIATAYEILRDDESRKEYEYMLDNPEAMYYHYYQYFKRKIGPKVDPKLVIAVFITLFSIAQYYVQYTNFHDGLAFCLKTPRIRAEAKEYALNHNLMDGLSKLKPEKGRKITKAEIKVKEEEILKDVIANRLNINPLDVKMGSLEKPSVKNTLWVQMFTGPVALSAYVYSWCRWIYRYYVLRLDLTEEDKLEQIRWSLGVKRSIWNSAPKEELDYYMKRKLWIKENYEKYAEELEIERRKKLAENTKYKRYQRIMRKGGPHQMTFGQEDVDMDYS